MFLFLALLLFFASGVSSASCTRDNVLSWMNTSIDTNHDGFVNVTEINRYILYDPCRSFPPRITGETAISFCDRNADGTLSATDYDAANSCAGVVGLMRIVCAEINKCALSR